MRFSSFIVFTLLLFNLSSCKSQKTGVTKTASTGDEKKLLKMDTLKNGSKKLFIFKNKKLELIESYGFYSYKMVEHNKTDVIQYVYAINQDQIAYDGGYREEVVFEIPNDITEKSYADAELQNTGMLFGRYCFCRGKNGIFKVKQGRLHIKASKKEPHFELEFKITEVPQVTTEINY
jgi:hypothetical protein